MQRDVNHSKKHCTPIKTYKKSRKKKSESHTRKVKEL